MADPMTEPHGETDFFISYRGARTDWAQWINWVVRSAGFSTVLMDEFPIGTDWTDQMREACQKCRRLIPLYSSDYWRSGACRREFDTYLRQHLQDGNVRFLVPFETEPCTVPDMDAILLVKILHTLDRNAAHAAIRKVLEGITPVSSTSVAVAEPEPPFPGIHSDPAIVTEWPESVDELKWPLADHDDARAAFAELVTRNSRFKFLAIKGSSETGKSHLTMQFLNNAQRRVTACRCARFDFKGTDQIDQMLADFVHHLEVPLPPAPGSLSDRFRVILQSLAQRKRPSLLLFDTYEDASDADKRWVRDSLLTSLHRYPWLRVVIAGQEVPRCHSTPWAEDSKALELKLPNAAHWHTYAGANGRPISLGALEEVHKLTGGKASILAQICGPET